MLGPTVQLRRQIAAAATDRERQLETAAAGEVRDLELRVQDLEIGGRLDVGGRDGARPLLHDVHLDLGRLAVEARDQVLEVEDDVGHVLADARERRELVRDALDLHRGHRSALQRREEHPAQRVAERVPETAVERLDHEDTAVLVELLVRNFRNLEIGRAYCHWCPFPMP